jgi:hypothetical protein
MTTASTPYHIILILLSPERENRNPATATHRSSQLGTRSFTSGSKLARTNRGGFITWNSTEAAQQATATAATTSLGPPQPPHPRPPPLAGGTTTTAWTSEPLPLASAASAAAPTASRGSKAPLAQTGEKNGQKAKRRSAVSAVPPAAMTPRRDSPG